MEKNLIFENKYLKKELIDCIEKYENIYIAVAWAKYQSNDVSKKLEEYKSKIKQLIVGVEKEITDPEFLLNFMDKIKIIKQNDGLFHPKIYLFINKDESRWSLFIGSANLTYNALHKNSEAMVCLTEKNSSSEVLTLIKKQFINYENKAIEVNDNFINTYQNLYKKRKKVKEAKTYYGNYILDNLFELSWENYSFMVKNRNNDWYKDRIKLLKIANKYISNLDAINEDTFKYLLGLKKYNEGINWHHFGHMRISKKINYDELKGYVKTALNYINSSGEIQKIDYDNYMRIMLNIDGIGISIATRFLALKRPDIFFCVTGENIHQFIRDFNYKHKDTESYWKMVNEQFKKCKWYIDKIGNKNESDLWKAKVIMLDTILFEGTI